MKLKRLIKDLEIKNFKGSKEIEIEALTSNSKLASPGCMFIAKRGAKFDGNDYIHDAILAGATCILTDIFNPFFENIAQIIVGDVPKAESKIAKEFFQDPARELFMVGITGTKGKTTTSYLTKHIFNGFESMGLIGTIERIVGENSYTSDLTTADCITTLKLLREMIICHDTAAVLEISSHGLAQNRADPLSFDVAVFTNLSPEHLDYHSSMEDYFLQKKKLFSRLKPSGVAIINVDDPYSKRLDLNHPITIGIDSDAEYRAGNIRITPEGTYFELHHQEQIWPIFVPLIGKFNVYNVLCAIAIARVRKFPMEMIIQRLKTFPPISGRMERIELGDEKTAYIDFCHTEDSLRQALLSLRDVTSGKIVLIFGCGGNRDALKRPQMAKVAEELADLTIITNDNPRNEDPVEIARAIIQGFRGNNYELIYDRKEAIARGISLLNQGDLILIAGKGHEKKQIFQGKSVDFDDIAIAKELANCV